MKKSIFRLLAVVAVVGLAVSCGGGGDDDDDQYNFSGRWAGTFVVTVSNVPGIPVGFSGPDGLIITQSGNTVSVKYLSMPDELVMNGTCAPTAKTFSAAGTDTDGISHNVSGAAIDEDSMSGTFAMQKGGVAAQGTWTVDLLSRYAAGQAAGAMREVAGVIAR